MYMTVNKLRFLLAMLLNWFLISSPEAQNYTASPYSMFGIGEAVTGTNGRNPALGGTGIGQSSNDYLNLANPASLGSLDSSTFYFDIGFTGSLSTYRTKTNMESSVDGNFNSIAMGFKPTNRWGMAFGFLPVSSVGYKIKSSNYIEGSTATENIWFEGSGGLSKFFFSNAFRITPGITAGINTSMVFGTINHDEIQDAITINHESQTNAFYAELGIQYKTFTKNNNPIVFGLVYGPGARMNMESKLEVLDNAGYLLSSEKPQNKDKYIPEYFGIGTSLRQGEKWNFAFDYMHQNWSKSQSGQTGIYYTNTHKIAMGTEFIPNPRKGLKYFEKINYRAGFSIENSYLKIREQNPLIYKTTIGFGLPIRYGSMLNLGLGWEKSSAQGNSIINQSTFRINIGLSFTEPWFYKRKFD